MPPNDRSRPPSPQGWRSAAPGKAGKGPQFGWKPEDQSADTKRLKRRIKLSAWLFGGLTCVALIALLIWFLRPQKSATLVLVGIDPDAEYENLDTALDPYGWQGGKRLAAWSRSASQDERFSRSKMAPLLADGKSKPESLRPETLDAWLKDLDRRDFHTLVIYFGLHGGADGNGPFLFTAGGKLHLSTLIEAIGSRSGLKDKKIVLLLDPARILPDPAFGMLHNDCVRSLKALDKNDHIFDRVPNLVVICSSDSGEQGWSAEEWGTTGFAQMLLNGMNGDAEPSKGYLISAWDLYRYVRERTASWSADRLTPQTPILLPESGGEERAKAMDVSVRPKDWTASKWPELRSQANVPQSLEDHWKECFKFEKATPSPAVYSPLVWRRYRELLLRYEQLVRADETDAAGALDSKLRDMEGKLSNDRSLRTTNGSPLASRGNSLSMAAALGVSSGWTMSDEQLKKVWRSPTSPAPLAELLSSDAAKADAASVRLQIYRQLLDMALNANADPKDVTVAANIFKQTPLLEGGKRPAEAHSLLMTNEFYQDKRVGTERPADLVRQALTLRQLAERAALGETGLGRKHPYSEVLWPHLKKGIIDADITRRDAEDLLLASNDTGYARVRGELSSAQKKYEAQLADAKKLQEAYALRDEALADLPLLTRWIALQLLIPPTSKNDDLTVQMQADAELLPGLWAKVHELARQLEGAERLAGLGALTDIRTQIDQLKRHFTSQCADLATRDLQGLWRQNELILAAPPMFIDEKTRKNLLANNRRQSVKLTGAWQNKPKSESPTAGPVDGAMNRDARARTLQQGQLAAAVLGELSTEQAKDNPTTPLYSLDNFRGKLSDLAKEDNWQPTANRIGDDIGRHWGLLAPHEKDGVDEKLTELRGRWSIAFRPLKLDPEPASANRRRRWRDLLVAMALRTARDHWYELSPESPAYYRDVAKLFLADAANIGGGVKPVDEEKEIKALLEANALDLKRDDFTERVNWTSENYRDLNILVDAPKSGPGGYVVLWGDLKQNAALSLPAEAKTRMPAALPDANRRLRVEAIPQSVKDEEMTELAVNGYYRGQWLANTTKIKLNRTPDRILTWVQPVQDSAVAVRASDDLDLGAIAIVLDYSGSMKETPTNRFNENTEDPTCKYQQALKTLREVLLDLPQGTPLCIRVFGHEAEAYQESAPVGVKTKATRDKVFFNGKVSWRRGANEGPLDELIMNDLRATKPLQFTPLLRTMTRAKVDFPKEYEGSKTMLVLTDGADSMYGAGAPAVARVKEEFVEAFSKSDIAVQMVFFSWDKDERKWAGEQFQDITGFVTPGRFRFTDNDKELKEFIDQALRPKLRLVKANGNPAPRTNPEGKTLPGAGIAANRQTDALNRLRWSDAFKPDFYKGRVFKSVQEFEFQPGDRMMIRLSKDRTGRPVFERDLFARSLMNRGPSTEETAAGWMMGLAGYRASRDGAGNHLKFTGTLESLSGREPGENGVLQQTYPGFVWWDVTTVDGKKPKVLHIATRTLSPVPAPAWNITAEAYSDRADDYKPATLQAWVDDARPTASYPPVPIDAGRLDTGQAIKVQGADGDVQVFLSIKDKVDVTNGELTKIPYLVVRVLHPKGKPVFVRPPQGSDFTASEQRFYSDSDAVTAVFGPVSREGIEGRLQGRALELISISQFKDRHRVLEMKAGSANPSEQDYIYPQKLGDGSDDGGAAAPPG